MAQHSTVPTVLFVLCTLDIPLSLSVHFIALRPVDCTVLQLAPLRVHKNMKSLNLSGNPLCQSRDYRLFCIAYFKPLVFLDYTMIEAIEVSPKQNVVRTCREYSLGEYSN